RWVSLDVRSLLFSPTTHRTIPCSCFGAAKCIRSTGCSRGSVDIGSSSWPIERTHSWSGCRNELPPTRSSYGCSLRRSLNGLRKMPLKERFIFFVARQEAERRHFFERSHRRLFAHF